METIAFWALAAVIVVSAMLVVVSRNIVHSILWLVLVFLGIAGVFLMLNAPFLAAIQVLVYAGAVSIMIVFGVMLTQRGDMKKTNPFNARVIISALIAGLTVIAAAVLTYLSESGMQMSNTGVPTDTVGNIGELMLTKYVVPFEAAAILLLVALIGAVFLAKEVKADD